MTIISSKTGILCIINIVVACVVIGTLTNATTGNVAVKGNYFISTTTSGSALLVIASVSLILHFFTVISSFMGDECSVLRTNYFFLNQIIISIVYFSASVSLFVFTEFFKYNLVGLIDLYRTANSFGIIGCVLCAATAFLAKKEIGTERLN